MRNAITPSLLASSTSLVDGKDGSLFDDFLENKAMQAGNLSCTLEKLYIWERKLHAEVKVGQSSLIVIIMYFERYCSYIFLILLKLGLSC